MYLDQDCRFGYWLSLNSASLAGVFPKPRVVTSGVRACPEQVTAQPECVEWGSRVQHRCSTQDPSLRLNTGFAQDDAYK